MENEFVTYEQALALKELGFDEHCFGRYYYKESYPMLNPNSGETELVFEFGQYIKQTEITILAPLYQQAFRWFREKHNLVFNFISYNIVKPGEYHWSITWNDEAKVSGIVKTYEEAEQACLDKLIEICKTK
jgi:hypothetical protein